jgi:hypothetical protein
MGGSGAVRNGCGSRDARDRRWRRGRGGMRVLGASGGGTELRLGLYAARTPYFLVTIRGTSARTPTPLLTDSATRVGCGRNTTHYHGDHLQSVPTKSRVSYSGKLAAYARRRQPSTRS